MTSSKLLYAALRDTEISCVPEGIHHITEIYAIVQASYPKWCDNDNLYWNAPEWKHKVRTILCKFKIKGRVQQDGLERGYWRILLNIRWEEKIGYEATCGGRQWWHRNQKECQVFLYGDIRKIDKGVFENKYMPIDPKTGKKKTSNWCIEPEVDADYRNLRGFPSNHFHNVCWDPPHMIKWTSGLISMKYGALEQGSGNYFDDLRRGFMELWRILAPNGTLVFKWNDISLPIHKVLSFFPIDYKYGITSNKAVIIEAGGTAVCIFVKDEESNLIATRTFEEVSEELKSIQTSLLGWD
jgi:hypothetical protein